MSTVFLRFTANGLCISSIADTSAFSRVTVALVMFSRGVPGHFHTVDPDKSLSLSRSLLRLVFLTSTGIRLFHGPVWHTDVRAPVELEGIMGDSLENGNPLTYLHVGDKFLVASSGGRGDLRAERYYSGIMFQVSTLFVEDHLFNCHSVVVFVLQCKAILFR